MVSTVQILAVIGLLLSVYTWHIVYRAEKSKTYKAVCDFNERMSCTKVFRSKYGAIFGIPNHFYGIGFYLAVLLLDSLGYNNLVLYMAIASIALSVYLAYASLIKERNFCLVCNAVYLVNALLLFASF